MTTRLVSLDSSSFIFSFASITLSYYKVPTVNTYGNTIEAQYKVYLKNQNGNIVAIFDEWRSLQFYKRVNEKGSFLFSIDGDDPRVDLFELDGQIEIWRSHPRVGIDWYIEFEGLIRLFRRSMDKYNKETFSVYGFGYNELLSRRIIAYKASHPCTKKSGAGETVMKEFVRENLGADATTANGRLIDGVCDRLIIQEDFKRGGNWDGQRSYINLLKVCQQISTTCGIDFQVRGCGANLYEFIVYEGQLGNNRSSVGIDPVTGLNAYGFPPVVFSTYYDNMSTPQYELDRSSETNVAIVAGQGWEEEREVVVEVGSTLNDSPLNQRERLRDARTQEDEEELISIGEEVISYEGGNETFSFDIISSQSSVYGLDFYFGDIVTAVYKPIVRHLQVSAIDIFVDSGNEIIKIALGKPIYD